MRHVARRLCDWISFTLIGVMIAGGAYILWITAAPGLPDWASPGTQTISVATARNAPLARGDRLVIPQIGVDVAIMQGQDVSVLDAGAWHRQPQNGDPQNGGNFVLSAHRFAMGWTPQETRAKSPFYKIDRLKIGDDFFVDYRGARYNYRVVRTYDVPRTAIQIEAPSEQPKLTLYSCDLRGEAAGRVVVEAEPYGVKSP